MPIRSITIDWGDGKKLGPLEGKYQNHKPRCQRSAGEELGFCKQQNNIYYGYACADPADCAHLGNSSTCINPDDRFGGWRHRY